MTSPTSQLQVQHININELKANKLNPRTCSDYQLAKLRESIEKFGIVDYYSTASYLLKLASNIESLFLKANHEQKRSILNLIVSN